VIRRFVCWLRGHSEGTREETVAPIQERCITTFCTRCGIEIAFDFPDVTPIDYATSPKRLRMSKEDMSALIEMIRRA
jgi:hypothetical protein